MLERFSLTLTLLLGSLSLHAQYTETINTNIPGRSQGAYAPGVYVFQAEVSPYYGQEEHSLLNYESTIYGTDFQLRAGLFLENLELNYIGDFRHAERTRTTNIAESEETYTNFSSNTVGLKYLVYDPWKKRSNQGPNLYSWKANNSFQTEFLIPSVSVYAGANLDFSTPNIFTPPDNASVSPKVAVITQNNLGSNVIVLNLIYDRIGTDFPMYEWIATFTHSFSTQWSAFVEYQGFKSDFYSDNFLRAGAAYLLTKDFQIDVAATTNFKDTPTVLRANLGFSYRLDFHSDEEIKQKNSKLNDGSQNKLNIEGDQ